MRKQQDQNCVEKEEDLEVPNDICKHNYDWSQRRENPQEKECFAYKKADDGAHEDTRRKYPGVKDDLNDGICDTSPDVDEISVVTRVREVHYDTSLFHLSHIIEHGVEDTHEQGARINIVDPFIVFYHAAIVHIEAEDTGVE